MYFLTNKLTQRGCAVSHRNCNSQSRIHPKMSPASSSFSQRLVLCILYSRPRFHETVPVCRAQCEGAPGLLPAHGHHPGCSHGCSGHHPGSAHTRALICRSNEVLLPKLHSWVYLPVLLFRRFFLMQEKSIPDWISSDQPQGEGQSNPGVHLAPFSCLHLVPPTPLRPRRVILCHKRGGDSSMW